MVIILFESNCLTAWFSKLPNWLEYSVAKNAAFCLCCYLSNADIRDQVSGDSFVGKGFSNWKEKKIQTHVGGPNSAHNQALSKCQDLLNQSQHIQTIFFKQSDQARIEYQARLNSSVDCVKSLLRQGYDGASNMQGEFNGLKTLILKENPCAYYVHCFTHQLQLALVAVAKNHNQISLLFTLVSNVVNVVGASCKRRDIVREKQAAKVAEALNTRELSSGQGLNQETNLKHAGDIHWGSHYGTLVSLASMFSTVIDVLEMILEDGSNSEQRAKANVLLDSIQSFEFVFNLHLMKTILAITSELSQALQRKDQDIVNAINLVQISKVWFQKMRESGWTSLLDDILSFCEKNEIDVPQMEDIFVARGRKRRNAQEIKNLHHYRAELFYTVLDMQIQELNARFTELNTELYLCVACLNPSNSFSSFDRKKLIHLAEFYPKEFSSVELMVLNNQLDTYIIDMLCSSEFSMLNGIADLAKKIVATGRDKVYPLVYLLLTLALILHVAIATVEMVFSAMNIVKNRLRNRMGDEWINDSLVVYIKRDIFYGIDNDTIMERFQKMKTRQG
ncbi:zinc finger MYM-type protein 1-like [Camellia sinensis]|uniref:zinc finger MYM-type protein 1-like n=1 Tax=Camellia sinensis TaxID=4442 RepID=UPI001036E10E|nr:zinc finger MYM-type protein 1-like [Camellia sinensis]